MKKEKRIPTILGLVLLLGSIFGGILLTSQRTSFNSKASGNCTPGSVHITNITDKSFDVSFTTSDPCLSSISIDNRTIPDLRFVNTDRTETPTKVHYFEINNLRENSDYNFSLISNGNSYSRSDYRAKTGSKPSTPIPTSNLAWGRVYTPDLKPADESIVYLNINGASPLSAFVTTKGHWNISLAISFNESRNDWFSPPANQSEEIIVISANNQITQINGNTSRNNPVPDIIIGQNQFSPQPVADYGTGEIELINQTTPVLIDKDLSIDNPKEDEPVFTLRPDFFGQGPANAVIDIEINDIKSQTNSASDGVWHWSPPKDLSSGSQTINASTLNRKTNSTDTVSRKFTVVATEGNVGMAFSASQSAAIQTPTPTLVTTPASTTPTNTPTSTPSPTAVPTEIAPTATATTKPVVRTSKPSTDSGIPASGFTFPTAIIAVLSVVLIIASIIIL